MGHDVFLSHSHVDKAIADEACALLESNGIRCWIAPRNVTAGMPWGAAIVEAIAASRAMVLILSSQAGASPQVSREVERAVHMGKPIIPFRIEDVALSDELQFFLSNTHWLDALTPPLKPHLEELVRTTALILANPGRAATVLNPMREGQEDFGTVPIGSQKNSRQRTRQRVAIASTVLFVLGGGGWFAWQARQSVAPTLPPPAPSVTPTSGKDSGATEHKQPMVGDSTAHGSPQQPAGQTRDRKTVKPQPSKSDAIGPSTQGAIGATAPDTSHQTVAPPPPPPPPQVVPPPAPTTAILSITSKLPGTFVYVTGQDKVYTIPMDRFVEITVVPGKVHLRITSNQPGCTPKEDDLTLAAGEHKSIQRNANCPNN